MWYVVAATRAMTVGAGCYAGAGRVTWKSDVTQFVATRQRVEGKINA